MSSKKKAWKEVNIGAVCSKSSTDFMTGDWKTYTPIRDLINAPIAYSAKYIAPKELYVGVLKLAKSSLIIISVKAVAYALKNAQQKQLQ